MYKLKDFYIAVALMSTGFQLKDVEAVPDQKYMVFVFEDPDNRIPKVIEAYWAGELKVNALGFMHNLKELRSRLAYAQSKG